MLSLFRYAKLFSEIAIVLLDFKFSFGLPFIRSISQFSLERLIAVTNPARLPPIIQIFCFFMILFFINNKDRGMVWEEIITNLDSSIQLVMLSATINGADKLASWVGNLKQVTCHHIPIIILRRFYEISIRFNVFSH